MFSLTHRVELRVASQCRCGEKLDQDLRAREITRVTRMFAETFGGAEVAEIKGFFVMADGRLAAEDVSVVSAYVEKVTPTQIASLQLHARALAGMLEQESVALVVNGSMTFHETDNVHASCAHTHEGGN